MELAHPRHLIVPAVPGTCQHLGNGCSHDGGWSWPHLGASCSFIHILSLALKWPLSFQRTKSYYFVVLSLVFICGDLAIPKVKGTESPKVGMRRKTYIQELTL